MAQQIESVHQGNPYLQERAALEKRRRANLALAAAEEARTVEQARVDQLQRFGEACAATVDEARVAEEAAHRRSAAAERSERRHQTGASSSRETEPTALVPVMDMRFCINNLDAIRMEAGDSPLSEFSDFWAPDHRKTTPNRANTFVPNCLVKGSNPLWAQFYDSG